jgi:phage-related protein
VADDINLPNLVSHLNVNLDGLNGTIADATRQGSSVGAALGGGVQRELQGLLAHLPEVQIDANSDDVDRDLARVRQQLDELSRQRIGVDVSIEDALRRIGEITPHLQRLSDTHPDINVQVSARGTARQLEDILAAARRVDAADPEINVAVDEDGPNRLAGLLGRVGAAGASAGASIAASMATASAALGAAAPLAAGLVTTLANVAPAAGVAVTGLAAVKLAQGAVKLAAVGMDDALGAALDPAKAEEFNEALKKLSPNARAFATTVRDAAPALRDLQQGVQDRVFAGLDGILRGMSTTTLPVLRNGLNNAGIAVNLMAKNVGNAAIGLSKSGTLGRAISSANIGLLNLAKVPGQLTVALGQVAAAAGPSFERLTAAAESAADGLSDRLSAAFESGRMQQAIEGAIDLIGDLVEVGANVGEVLGNVFSAVPEGGGMVGVLQDVTAALADITASTEVQTALRTLFETMGVIGQTAAPLLAQALSVIAPVITALGPPVQTLVAALGDALSPVIEALGPVLEAAAGAVGALIQALAPLLPMFGQLIAAFLPVLVPLFDALRIAFEAVAPSVELIAEILSQSLSPILAALPAVLQPLLTTFTEMAQVQGPLLADLLRQLQPSFVQLGEAFGLLLAELGPLLVQFGLLYAQLFAQIAPHLPPLIDAFAQLATVFTGQLVWVIENVVVPALSLLNAMLSGDTRTAAASASGAMRGLQTAMATIWTGIVSYVQQKIAEVVVYIGGLPARASAALSGLAGSLSSRMSTAGAALRTAASGAIAEALILIASLPSRAGASLGGLGGVLYGAGASLISGFISGIRSMIPSVQSVLGGLTSQLPDWKGPKAKDAKILTPAGKLLIEGFIKGINGATYKLKSTLASITKALPANVKSGYGKQLKAATAELSRLITERDKVLKRLESAEKKLSDLQRARKSVISDIKSGIISDANITEGRAEVNSVSAITIGLQRAAAQAKVFQANIAKLRKAGLRNDLLQQIAEAGVEGGAATAAALAKATPQELAKINSLQGQLAKAAGATGTTVGDALYGAGIRAAEGLVAGLKSQEASIEAQMRKIAQKMLSTIKKEHKTKSPSRAFHEIGVMDGEGLRGGLLASARRVKDAARAMAAGALDAASGVGDALAATPTARQLAAVYAGGGRGDSTYHINMYGARATPAELVRELSWRGLVGGG